MKPIEERKNINIRGDSFDLAYAEYFYGDRAASRFLNERKHRFHSKAVSYRILNHWEQKGLLSTKRPEGKGWRKYSILDIVWVHIVSRLREFGFALEKIHLVKEHLSHDDESLSAFPELEFYVARALAKVPSYIAIFPHGEALLCTLSEFQVSRSYGFIRDDSILICLNDILQRIYGDKDLKPDYSTNYDLTKEEVQLLIAIRLDLWSEIKIRGKDGKITMIERTENIENETKVIEILRSHNYQNIELKQVDGKVVSFKRTVKKKIE